MPSNFREKLIQANPTITSKATTIWLCGIYMGVFMLSFGNPNEKHRKLIIFPEDEETSQMLDWQVSKILKD